MAGPSDKMEAQKCPRRLLLSASARRPCWPPAAWLDSCAKLGLGRALLSRPLGARSGPSDGSETWRCRVASPRRCRYCPRRSWSGLRNGRRSSVVGSGRCWGPKWEGEGAASQRFAFIGLHGSARSHKAGRYKLDSSPSGLAASPKAAARWGWAQDDWEKRMQMVRVPDASGKQKGQIAGGVQGAGAESLSPALVRAVLIRGLTCLLT